MAINYTEVGWDTTKYVNPTNMNQMDDGIKAACDGVDALDTEMGTTDISSIGDGTVTGAIDALNSDNEWTQSNISLNVGDVANLPDCREFFVTVRDQSGNVWSALFIKGLVGYYEVGGNKNGDVLLELTATTVKLYRITTSTSSGATSFGLWYR